MSALRRALTALVRLPLLMMRVGADAGHDRTCHPNGDTFPTETISLTFEPFKADTGDVQLNGLNLRFRDPAYSGRPGMA